MFLVCKRVIGHGSELCHEVSVYLKKEKLIIIFNDYDDNDDDDDDDDDYAAAADDAICINWQYKTWNFEEPWAVTSQDNINFCHALILWLE